MKAQFISMKLIGTTLLLLLISLSINAQTEVITFENVDSDNLVKITTTKYEDGSINVLRSAPFKQEDKEKEIAEIIIEKKEELDFTESEIELYEKILNDLKLKLKLLTAEIEALENTELKK